MKHVAVTGMGVVSPIASGPVHFGSLAGDFNSVLPHDHEPLGTVNERTKIISSAMVDTLWTAVSPAFGLGVAGLLMGLGTLLLGSCRNGEVRAG